MFYRVRCDLAFSNLPAIDKVKEKVLPYLAQAVTINPGQPNEEPGFLSVEKCYHDEGEGKECELIFLRSTSP